MSAPDDLAGDDVLARPRKSPTAFRTISEVADDLHIPQHVLRFWETKFPQVKPLKRGGGRRYYRPDDIALLRTISDLLYTQGYTIKGVQRLLQEGSGRLQEDLPLAESVEHAEPEIEILEAEPVQGALPVETVVDIPHKQPSPDPTWQLLGRVLAELEQMRSMLA